MVARRAVKLTANFERNVEAFVQATGTPQAFDALLDELTDSVIPNLERFPGIGRSFLERPTYSVETNNGAIRLTERLNAMGEGSKLREYATKHHLLLYAQIKDTVYLLSIRHHRQLSFDLASHWPA